MKFVPKVYEALVMLRGNPHFDIFLREGIAEYITQETQRCIACDGVLQSRAAGAVQALQTLKTSIESAPQILEKIRSNTAKAT